MYAFNITSTEKERTQLTLMKKGIKISINTAVLHCMVLTTRPIKFCPLVKKMWAQAFFFISMYSLFNFVHKGA